MLKAALRRILFAPTRLLAAISTWKKRRRCLAASTAILHDRCRIINNQRRRESIRIGHNTSIYGDLLVLAHGGNIDIGSDSFVSEDTRIWSAESIKIGNRVLISHQVNIHDNDSHSLSASHRHKQYKHIVKHGHPSEVTDIQARAVLIDDDAWIGFGATILKGVTVGRGAVVGACAVVTKDVPEYTIVVGHPAGPIGRSRP